ncbi:protein rep [Brevibacillus borstelensis]|uniref:protein rep n=1 Tax=Brevibacillus borstelensis TaxID=45462 RepID=UPI00203E39AF|nr:protein rep [Brevibacillus borstelensis]MCM3625650.1 protein rep [Brevibacillus borstelensis]
MCQWRRSLLVAHQIKQVCHEAVKVQKMRWLFLTLTCRNVSGEDLSKQIDHLMKSWKRLTLRKEFKAVVGWFRAFEVTRNMQDGTYHPHFHVLLGVKPMYFDTGYVKQEEWVRIWGECLEVDYEPVVDIRIVRNKPNNDYQAILAKKGIEIKADGRLVEADLSGSAVAELAKYSAKSGDFIVYNRYKMREVKGRLKFVPDAKSGIDTATTDEVVATLDDSLARRRLYAFGGLLKEVFARLEAEGKIKHADDPDADLVHVEEKDTQCKCSACASDMVEELYSWIPDVRNYIKKEKALLD